MKEKGKEQGIAFPSFKGKLKTEAAMKKLASSSQLGPWDAAPCLPRPNAAPSDQPIVLLSPPVKNVTISSPLPTIPACREGCQSVVGHSTFCPERYKGAAT